MCVCVCVFCLWGLAGQLNFLRICSSERLQTRQCGRGESEVRQSSGQRYLERYLGIHAVAAQQNMRYDTYMHTYIQVSSVPWGLFEATYGELSFFCCQKKDPDKNCSLFYPAE